MKWAENGGDNPDDGSGVIKERRERSFGEKTLSKLKQCEGLGEYLYSGVSLMFSSFDASTASE